ncbi:hypothetical protein STEG23_037731 [Scotinomys teguina]
MTESVSDYMGEFVQKQSFDVGECDMESSFGLRHALEVSSADNEGYFTFQQLLSSINAMDEGRDIKDEQDTQQEELTIPEQKYN